MPNLKIYITTIILILYLNIVYSDIIENSANVSIRLSNDSGTTYTIAVVGTIPCTALGDNTVVYGGESSLWGKNWTAAELNNTNFRLRLNFTSKTALGSPKVDHVKIRVYYTLPTPNPIFVSPTPSNNTNIGSTLKVNFTSTTTMTACWLSNNITGTWRNTTMNLSNDSLTCYRQFTGEDEGINNNTFFQFHAYGNASGQVNSSELRQVRVNSLTPFISSVAPINNTSYNQTGNIMLNISINDSENDLFDYFVFGSNNLSLIQESVISHGLDKINGTFTYNWTSPVVDRNSPGLKVLYHFDKRVTYGENLTNFYDFSGNGNNGTENTNAMANMTFSDEGYLGGAFHYDGSFDWIDVNLNVSPPLTVTFWAKGERTNCAGLTRAESFFSASTNEYYNSMYLQGQYCQEINLYGNSSATSASLTITPTGFNHSNWNHYVAVVNLSGFYIYLNGILAGNQTQTNVSRLLYFPNGIDIGNLPDFTSGSTSGMIGLIDEFAVWNRTLNSSDIWYLFSLNNGTYHWNASAMDTATQINTTELRQFTIHPLCYYDCSLMPIINDNVNCNNNALTFYNPGNVIINANISYYNTITVESCYVSLYGAFTKT